MKCVLCGAPFAWDAPGQNGRMQSWRRLYIVDGRGRLRCADRNACKNRKDADALRLDVS